METNQYGYHLAIPNRYRKRSLGYLKQKWIEFKEYPSMDGFFEIMFPGLDEEGFKDIVNKLKAQGVFMIGVDDQLTEKKIMKLTDLMNEQLISYPLGEKEEGPSQGFQSNDIKDVLLDLKNILKTWETKSYNSAEDRYLEYFLDIEELVKDYEMGMEEYDDGEIDEDEDTPDIYNDKRIRERIRNEIKRIFQ